MNSLIPKARKAKFELVLRIIDLNNVPLVTGTALVKWHLPSSTSAEHRGRTQKQPVKDHKVLWDYTKTLPVRLIMNKSNLLTESILHIEVLQEYNSGIGGRSDKIVLGTVALNLAEYVEGGGHGEEADEGITRRYLMQDSKINSTLRVGIAMKQVDGEKNFVAPPLKTAPIFGAITGIMDFEQAELDDLGHMSVMNRNRDEAEAKDMYRQGLAASWGVLAGEHAAEDAIDDIFSGGDGWKHSARKVADISISPRPDHIAGQSDEEWEEPTQIFRQRGHRREISGSSIKSESTIKGKTGKGSLAAVIGGHSRGDVSRERSREGRRGSGNTSASGNGGVFGHDRRKGSTTSLATQGSSSEGTERGRKGWKRVTEVDEFDVREDLVAWELPR